MIRVMRYAILGGLVLVSLLVLGSTRDWSTQSSTRVPAIDLPVQTVVEDARPQARQHEPTARTVQPKPKAKAKPTVRARPKRIEARKPPRVTRTSARAPAASQSRGAAPVRSSPPVQIQSGDDDDADSDVDAAARPAPAPQPAARPAPRPAPRPATPQGDNDDGDGAAGGQDPADGDD